MFLQYTRLSISEITNRETEWVNNFTVIFTRIFQIFPSFFFLEIKRRNIPNFSLLKNRFRRFRRFWLFQCRFLFKRSTPLLCPWNLNLAPWVLSFSLLPFFWLDVTLWQGLHSKNLFVTWNVTTKCDPDWRLCSIQRLYQVKAHRPQSR
jgi:hypothetical protein